MVNPEIDEEELWERVTGKKSKPLSQADARIREWQPPTERHIRKVYLSGPKSRLNAEKRLRSIRYDTLLKVWRDVVERTVYVPESESPLEKRVSSLENEMRKLKSILIQEHEIPEVDRIYEKFKEELESKYFGKIVAIDLESEIVAGIGSSVLEAYEKAKEKSPKNKFSYKRVGYAYVFKL